MNMNDIRRDSMKHNAKNLLVLLLLLCFTVSCCGMAAVATAESKPGWEWEKYDPEITLTMNMSLSPLLIEQIPEGYTVEENEYTQWTRETMGIVYKAKWIAPSPEVNSQRINLAIVSGDIPDVIACTGNELAALVQANLVIPWDGLLEQYGSPLTNEILDAFNETTQGGFYAPYTYNQQKYGLPTPADIWAMTWNSNWIRTDILQALGKEMPETLADLEDIMAAYKTAYPDGIGLTLWTTDTAIGGIESIMGAFSVFPGKWMEAEDGSLVYGSVQPAAKDGLAVLSDWYQKGYLDKEFVVKDLAKSRELFTAGNGLCYVGSWGAVWSPFPDLMTNVESATMAMYGPLKNANGKPAVMLNNAYGAGGGVLAINAKFANPEAIIYAFNEDNASNSVYRNNEALRERMKSDYGYEFRYPVTPYQTPMNPDALPGAYEFEYTPEQIGPGYFNHAGGIYNYGPHVNQGATELVDQYLRIMEADANGTYDNLTQLDKDEKQKYLAISERRWPALASAVQMWKDRMDAGDISYDKFAGAPTETMIEKNAYLKKLELETYASIIMGEKPLDAFDAFVDEWNNAGGADITKEVNEWKATIG